MECPLRFTTSSSTVPNSSSSGKDEVVWPKLLGRDTCLPCTSSKSKYSTQTYPPHFLGNNFYRMLRLSPDGYNVVAVDERQNLSFYSLPAELVQSQQYYVPPNNNNDSQESPATAGVAVESPTKLDPYAVVNFGENVYDVAWGQNLPSVSSSKDNSVDKEEVVSIASLPYNSLFVSMKDHPIQLYSTDDLTQPVAHYVGYDHMDEVESHHSLCYQSTGTAAKLYAGAEKKIRIFDVSRPGHEVAATITTLASNKCEIGQRGIISVLALQPHSTSESALLAAGSFAGAASTVSLYNERNGKYGSVMDITGFQQGVTCLQWSSCGTYLWVGTRSSTFISCYDVRSLKALVCTITKEDTEDTGALPSFSSSNQRMCFALDPWSRYLATGSYSAGGSQIFDIYSGQRVLSVGSKEDDMRVNACVFHPFSALMLTASGHRVFEESGDDSSDSDSSDGEEECKEPAAKRKKSNKDTKNKSTSLESHISVWALDREPLVFENSMASNCSTEQEVTATEEAAAMEVAE